MSPEHFALYFKSLTVEEFRDKLIESFHFIDPTFRLRNTHLIGPSGIKVILTPDVIKNMTNDSIYLCTMTKSKSHFKLYCFYIHFFFLVDDEFDVTLQLTNLQQ